MTTNRPVLVYDGDCSFSTRSARWLEARLASGAADVTAYQRLDLDALQLTAADVDAAAWWIEPDGTRHRGHQAIAAALRATGGSWGLAGRVLAAPPVTWAAGPVYAWIARHRHRMPGGSDACRLD